MIRTLFARYSVVVFLLGSGLATAAGCSSNAGFGSPPPVQGPQGTPVPQSGVYTSPAPETSGSATPTPSTPLIVDSATARQAYDASAGDPVKAARLVEITFALNNPGASPLPVSGVAVAADASPAVDVPLSLQALPNQDTMETLVAIAGPKDPSAVKQLSLTFSQSKTMLAQDSIDFPAPSDIAMTGLDSKRPNGGISVDDVAVTSIIAPGAGLHYDLTFSMTNASKSTTQIGWFMVTPPKGDPVTIAIPFQLAARTETTPISIVVPYRGKDAAKAKALPDGKYGVTALGSDGKTAIAQGSGPLL